MSSFTTSLTCSQWLGQTLGGMLPATKKTRKNLQDYISQPAKGPRVLIEQTTQPPTSYRGVVRDAGTFDEPEEEIAEVASNKKNVRVVEFRGVPFATAKRFQKPQLLGKNKTDRMKTMTAKVRDAKLNSEADRLKVEKALDDEQDCGCGEGAIKDRTGECQEAARQIESCEKLVTEENQNGENANGGSDTSDIVIDCTTFGPACPQNPPEGLRVLLSGESIAALVIEHLFPPLPENQSYNFGALDEEECLNLNIYVPVEINILHETDKNAKSSRSAASTTASSDSSGAHGADEEDVEVDEKMKKPTEDHGINDSVALKMAKKIKTQKLPVLVWIHGGGFFMGSNVDGGMYDASSLAKQLNSIVVCINYRLGPFGFLHFPTQNVTNLGLHDQICALHWVKGNIAAFGGDPDSVTISGESAGGMSVCALVEAQKNFELVGKAFRNEHYHADQEKKDHEDHDQEQGHQEHRVIKKSVVVKENVTSGLLTAAAGGHDADADVELLFHRAFAMSGGRGTYTDVQWRRVRAKWLASSVFQSHPLNKKLLSSLPLTAAAIVRAFGNVEQLAEEKEIQVVVEEFLLAELKRLSPQDLLALTDPIKDAVSQDLCCNWRPVVDGETVQTFSADWDFPAGRGTQDQRNRAAVPLIIGFMNNELEGLKDFAGRTPKTKEEALEKGLGQHFLAITPAAVMKAAVRYYGVEDQVTSTTKKLSGGEMLKSASATCWRSWTSKKIKSALFCTKRRGREVSSCSSVKTQTSKDVQHQEDLPSSESFWEERAERLWTSVAKALEKRSDNMAPTVEEVRDALVNLFQFDEPEFAFAVSHAASGTAANTWLYICHHCEKDAHGDDILLLFHSSLCCECKSARENSFRERSEEKVDYNLPLKSEEGRRKASPAIKSYLHMLRNFVHHGDPNGQQEEEKLPVHWPSLGEQGGGLQLENPKFLRFGRRWKEELDDPRTELLEIRNLKEDREEVIAWRQLKKEILDKLKQNC
ncbi:unnamed protein product [Amoebophrya sp. A25]|nr:unnamed protein product [Amoebophrya sp. A25]|eukprot:GSA25T00014630001.1